MTAARKSNFALLAALTILVSAFLLFQVQPVISKKILPWFGGSPAVWTTAMLFFQVVLLAGYAYAHLLIRYVPPTRQGIVHGILLLLALVSLPITPGEYWKPADGTWPALRILLLLLVKVGPTYFLLSATGPLVQAWYSQVYSGQSPYRLYALSNIGSLAALLSYPFLFEILLTVNHQGLFWSIGFGLFAGLMGTLAWSIWKLSREATLAAPVEPAQQADGTVDVADAPPSWWLCIAWVALAALASMSLLAITQYVCQDIAVVSFMWVVPLSLYLLSFIICFDSERWYIRKLWASLTIVIIAALSLFKEAETVRYELINMTDSKGTGWGETIVRTFAEPARRVWDAILPVRFTSWYDDNLLFQAILYVAMLFFICMVCHGELVRSKPRPRHLTMFFLMISAGGALGGLFVALICPLIFKTHFELALSILCGFVVAWVALANDGRGSWLKGREVVQWSMAFVVVGGILLVAKAQIEGVDSDAIMVRNFYGTLKVNTDEDGKSLYHGRILHGFQHSDPAREMEPTTYYVNSSGAGLATEHFPRVPGRGMRVAVIGLGTGTMASHGKPGDVYRFYDIDPKVVAISDKYFTYRKNSDAKTEVVLGDARIQMEREPDQNYDVIVLDAFSGDAIPAHLLTAEAIQVYERHLRKDENGQPAGIIAVHISNRYLDLEPVVAALARKFRYTALLVHVEEGIDDDTASDWVLLTRNSDFITNPTVASLSEPLKPDKPEILWTDQYSSLWPIIQKPWE